MRIDSLDFRRISKFLTRPRPDPEECSSRHSSAFFAVFFVVVFFAVGFLVAADFFVVAFLAVAVFFCAVPEDAVFFVVRFFGADPSSAAFSSDTSLPSSPAVSDLFLYPPRLSSGKKLGQSGSIQKGRLNPRPDSLNIVQPQTGQSSFTGTSQVMKSHLFASILLFRCSQQ